MKATTLFILSLLFTSSSFAAFIPASENPGVAPGPVVYEGSYPTPQQDPSTYPDLPSALSVVNINDDLRAALSFDLQALDQATDEGSGAYANGLLDITFLWYMGGVQQAFNFIQYSWADVAADQLAGLSLLTFWTDDYLAANNILKAGDWVVYAFAEESLVGFNQFEVVPEPQPLAMLSLMLIAGLGLRKLRR